MIGIERCLDVLSILVIAGIIGSVLYSMRKRGVRTRSLSEKPALFLEFTGKQVSVRRKKSRILPSYGEQAEAGNIAGAPSAPSGAIRISRTLAGFKDGCLTAAFELLRVVREGSERSRILMTATGRKAVTSAAQVSLSLKAQLDVANRARVAGLLKHRFRGGVQERMTATRKRLAGASIERLESLRTTFHTRHLFDHAVGRLRQGATDALLYLDYRWYRIERSVQSQRQQFKAATSRLARTPFKELHVVRVMMMKTRSAFSAQERMQGWLRKAQSVIRQGQQHLSLAGLAFQEAATDYIRRLSETKSSEPVKPEPAKFPTFASLEFTERTAAEPVVLSLTSSGTLKLKSRLEDDRTSIPSKSAVPMSAALKGGPPLSQVSVRYVGAQRRYGDPAESRQSKRAVK